MQDWLREISRRVCGALLSPLYRGVGCIVCLHRIVPAALQSPFPENRALELSPDTLRALLDWVRHAGLEVIRMEEVCTRLRSPRGEKFIAFTLDGGYRDALTDALPIFRDFGMPFMLNVTTGFLHRSAPLWWYSLEDALTDRQRFAFHWRGEDVELRMGNAEERRRAFAQIHRMVRRQGAEMRDDLVRTFCEAAGLDPLARTRAAMLEWDDLKTISGDWHVNVGSHTLGHHNLAALTDDEVEAELLEARAEIEARLDLPVRHAAYPFGGPDACGPREFDIARDTDFTTVTTTRCGNLFQQHAWHLQALPRLGVSGSDPAVARLRDLESGLIPARENRWKRVVVE